MRRRLDSNVNRRIWVINKYIKNYDFLLKLLQNRISATCHALNFRGLFACIVLSSYTLKQVITVPINFQLVHSFHNNNREKQIKCLNLIMSYNNLARWVR